MPPRPHRPGRRPIDPVILEQGDTVGTSWRHRHQDLRLNTIRWLSGLPGLRIPGRAGRWVARDDYIDYLERFTRHARLHVRCGVQARRIDPVAGGWQVTTDAGHYRGRHVIVATGHDRVPRVPDWPGRAGFQRPIRHVATLRRAADLAGARVLLVGAGNSGVEIAGHLVDAGVRQLWMSMRTPPTILPRQPYGVPLRPLTLPLRLVPEPIRDRLTRAVAHHAFGDLRAHGLPAPRQGPFERMRTAGVTIAIDQGFVGHLTAGRLRVVTVVDHLDGPDVVLRDGTRLRPDVVLAATGYDPGLTDLVGHLGVLDRDGRPSRDAGGHRPTTGLWFIGYRPAIEGSLRRFPIEARRIARAIGNGSRDADPSLTE
ncbi:flavin-containing monooxygenase [Streptosporangium sandarakinum]|uniref:flavin-containing monooxygenase n=1 Tax=Streptosporangium sandarakinum TaxID=1260955 RepID=UPI003420C66A